MRTKITEMFGIEAPILAFSHCRDVVVAVSKAGGMGVLGAERKTPEELEIELAWIEKNIGGKPYGVDALFAQKFDDVGRHKDVKPKDLIPARHREFVEQLLDTHHIPPLPEGEEDALLDDRLRRQRGTPAYSAGLLDVAFKFPGVKLMVSALGTPPKDIVDRAHAKGIKFGAMIGKVEHAKRQRDAGVDILIATGYEAGGHTGEITTMILTPEVVDAMAPIPVLAAGRRLVWVDLADHPGKRRESDPAQATPCRDVFRHHPDEGLLRKVGALSQVGVERRMGESRSPRTPYASAAIHGALPRLCVHRSRRCRAVCHQSCRSDRRAHERGHHGSAGGLRHAARILRDRRAVEKPGRLNMRSSIHGSTNRAWCPMKAPGAMKATLKACHV